MKKSVKKLVRVAVRNNFNCTSNEWNQLDSMMTDKSNQASKFFINTNIKTPNIKTINDNNVPVVLTMNPDLSVNPKYMHILNSIKKDLVSFVRVKWNPESEEIDSLIEELTSQNYKVVITFQRWKSIKSSANNGISEVTLRKYWKWERSYFRLTQEVKNNIQSKYSHNKNVYFCDLDGNGCQTCGTCNNIENACCNGLTYNNSELLLSSLNMSTSGICKFRCPDCFAHECNQQNVFKGNSAIAFDIIKQNDKQKNKAA